VVRFREQFPATPQQVQLKPRLRIDPFVQSCCC
jgi:hypothetical protein